MIPPFNKTRVHGAHPSHETDMVGKTEEAAEIV
jgi:hypothetical protein